ncbi:DNA repair protein Rev1 [Aricia agestis]|uniref:DNA repair protein Rev1 n=1 Tax=Aricia agestis TaxID=91739 RepID=UPI001C201C39|nr:DNA repair protein Rev1 [Aricia agestis]
MSRSDEKFPDNGFEAWGGYMRAKIAKLEEQFSATTSNEQIKVSNIFNGVSIYVNGYTIPSADELKELMAKHGGVYHTYQRSEDFIIASNLPDTKVKNMCLTRVVKPEWITESLKANRLLNYKDYLLYRSSKLQPTLNFQPNLKGETKNEVHLKNENQESDFAETFNSNDPCTSTSTNYSVHNNLPKFSNTGNTSTVNSSNISKNDKVTKNANDPNFLSEFYNNSRLHHISQLGAHFKQHVNELRENSDFVFPSREVFKNRLKQSNMNSENVLSFQNNKTIMHIDMDCFFVSVGLRSRPDLVGKPVAVTHSKGGQPRPKREGVDRATEFGMYKQRQAKKLSKATGVEEEELYFESKVDNVSEENDKFSSMSEIASCSYEARAKGVSNGMFMGSALKLCPNLQTIPYDFEGYKVVALTLYNTVAQYTLDIEAVSCDEMYVDCTDLLTSLNISAQDFARALREEIKSKTGCPCSTGFGGNRLQARLATKQAKPDGQFFLTANLVEEFMFGIKLRDLPGVGRQTSHKLESLGHLTCGSLQSLTLATLQQHFGNKTGSQLYDQCRGHDPVPLSFYTVRKSVSAEVNYGIRFENNEQCENFLKQLSEEVHSRLKQFKVLGKCITLKLMVRAKDAPVETAKFMGHGFCDVINKSVNLQISTDDLQTITREVITICKKQNIDPKEMRGIGIQITKLEALNNKPMKGTLTKFFAGKPDKIKQTNTPQLCLPANSMVVKKPTTPVKTKAPLSPLKKSPIISRIKSPTVKKRGRPPKHKPVSSSKNLISKFLQGQSSVSRTDVVHESIAQEEKPKIKEEKPEAAKKPQGFLALPWQKVRELLRAWFDSGQSPKQCDVNLIVSYMQEMVISKNLETLNILINFLRRRVEEIDSPEWYNVERCIIVEVQSAMLAVYGSRLYLPNR